MNPLLFFFQSASAGGVLLFLAAILGLVMANTGLAPYYEHFLHAELGPLPVHLWINDVLMAIFFLQVGLEVKREMPSASCRASGPSSGSSVRPSSTRS